MPNTVTQVELRRRMVEAMEPDLQISDKQAKDVVASLMAVVQEAISEGSKVNVFGIVNLTPSFRVGLPKRPGIDRTTGEETTFAARPAAVRVRATVPKKIKDSLPKTTSKAGKELQATAEERRKAYEKRQKERERELAGAGKGRK